MAKNFYTIHATNDAWHTYAVAIKDGEDVLIKIDNYATLRYSKAKKALLYYVEQAYRQITGDGGQIQITFDFRMRA